MKRGKSQKRDEAENIKVLVRSRPLNTKELDMGMQNAVDLDLTEGTVTVNHVCGAPDRWTFDAVVNNTFSQNDIFIQFIQPLVDSALEGFNATIFAYGQSGSGKTYTMSGGALQDHELRGIIPRSFTYIFNHIREKRNPNITYSLSCSFLELYNGKIRDLLAKQQVSLQIKESKDKTFYVNDLSTPQVKFVQDLLGHMEEGNVRRQVAATELNTDSSRSHSIFTVAIQMVENLEDGECRTVTSKLNLVDLAGSERQRKTRASGDTLKEGCNINLSLSALGTVIDTIVKGKGHIPFRSSPLTMLLKDSLGGTSKTVMFANINPADSNISETVSTLRFADRAKQIKNKPVMQMDAKDQKIQELLNKVQDLQDKLKQYENNEGPNLEEENERLEERICVVEAELSAAREELSDAVGAHNKSLNLKEEELDKLRRKYEALEESLQQEQDNLKLMMHTVEESAAEVADIKDITISFLSEVNEKDAAPNTLDEIRSALQSIKEYMFNSCSEKTLEEEGRKQQEQHAEQCAALKEEILQLEKSMQDTRMSYKEEKQNRKAQAATHKKEIEAMKQDHKAEVTTVRSEQNHQGQVSSKRDADIAELEDKLKGVQELIGNKQDTIMLEQRIKMLEEELKNREDEESQTVQTCKEHLQKNKTSHEEALEEVNRLRQIVTEPWYAHKCKQHNNSDNDTEAVRRYKMDIHVLHNSLSTLRTEKDQLSQELQTVKKSSLAEEKKAMRLASKCRGLEVGQEKMKQIAAALPAEAVENCFEADMEAKAQALETGITQRDAALDTLRQELVLEIERSTTRYVALTEDRDRLLSLMVQPEEGEPDEVAKLKQTVAYLTAELQKENQEVGKMHEKATKTVLELADRNKQMLANSTSSAGTININAAEDDTNTLKRLEEASTRIRELETMLSEPQEGDNGILMELKQELRQSIKTTANLGCEVELSAQKLLNEQAMTKKLREEYHSLQEAAKGSNTEQLAQELKDTQQEMEDLKAEKIDMVKEMADLTGEVKSMGMEEEMARDQHQRDMKRLQEATGETGELRDEVKKVTQLLNHSERTSAKLKKERDTAIASSAKAHERLSEKDDIIKSIRAMYNNQSKLLEKHKQTESEALNKLNTIGVEVKQAESKFNDRLQQEQAKWARYQSQRIEEGNQQHDKLILRKEEELDQMRKKLKKAHLSVQKVKERYDTKVLEAETLRGQLEEMKEDALKRLRDENINRDVDMNRDEISNIIRASKAARTRGLADSEQEQDDALRKKNSDLSLGDRRRSVAAKKFDGSGGATAAQQASAAARGRANGSVVNFKKKNSVGYEGRKGSQDETSNPVPVPAPPAMPHDNLDNDTPNHGINRELSPKLQFNPRNRHREVEERIFAVDERDNLSAPQPRGPSTLNKYTALPSRPSLSDDSQDALSEGVSMGLTASLMPPAVVEETRTAVALPGQRASGLS